MLLLDFNTVRAGSPAEVKLDNNNTVVKLQEN